MSIWEELASDESIEHTKTSLEANGIRVFVVANRNEAKAKVLELIPQKSEVMIMSSTTLDEVGLSEELEDLNHFSPVKEKLKTMDRDTQGQEMNMLGAAPQYAVGSVHAISEDGHCLIASNTGSQLPAYVYGASKVVWVAGTQKIVKNTDEGVKRIYEHSLPLEDKRAMQAYGKGSAVNKLLIVNRELKEGRIILILVKEKLGF